MKNVLFERKLFQMKLTSCYGKNSHRIQPVRIFFVNFQKILMGRAEKSRIFIWILFLNRDGNDEMNRNYNITIECEKFLEGVTQPSIEKGVQIVLRLVEVIFLARIVNLYEAEVCLEGIMPEEGLGIKTNYTCRMIISVLQVSSPCFCARFSLFRALCLERNLLYSIIFYYFLEKMLWGYLVGSSEYQQIAFFLQNWEKAENDLYEETFQTCMDF